MKKSVFGLLLCSMIFSNVFGQYEAGDIDFSLGGGVGLYAASTNDSEDSSGGGALNNLLTFNANYAITERLSLGYNYERNGFIFVGGDSTANDEGLYGASNNFRLNVVFRMVNGEKSSLNLVGVVGLSVLKFGNTTDSQEVKGSGLSYDISLNWQRIFGEHFGFYMSGGFGSYSYSKLTDQDGDVWKINDNSSDIKLTLSGVNLRGGLFYRL